MALNKGITLNPREEREDADELRVAVKEVIFENGKVRVQYEEALVAITVEESLKRYCQRIGRSNFWGGESELLGWFCKCLSIVRWQGIFGAWFLHRLGSIGHSKIMWRVFEVAGEVVGSVGCSKIMCRKKAWLRAHLHLMWLIWKEHNRRTFEGIELLVHRLKSFFMTILDFWLMQTHSL
ncbi:uncharacterized protein LOC130764191 isoform X1 [Actinidia eriantha]|uniref:uncharacterized protein LOC130764191 isoform X1 n=1 Tax=Actinidia eriantha TaxID=165200 RepID=UPI002587A71C|nr:uncharacterized protein LOC130764191 isoform X1 [Actinidia eriantha]